jgi:pimeloyl-ACP methyl ester carboxylesterase
MPGMRKCCFLDNRDTELLHTTAAAMAGRAQTWDGNNMDQYADDLSELIEHLDLKEITMVGHSTGATP